jgi:hypothetical protein
VLWCSGYKFEKIPQGFLEKDGSHHIAVASKDNPQPRKCCEKVAKLLGQYHSSFEADCQLLGTASFSFIFGIFWDHPGLKSTRTM